MAPPRAAPTALRILIPAVRESNVAHDSYVVGLLQLALERSRQAGEQIALARQPDVLTQHRLLAELSRGNLDVAWTMTSETRETSLRPIRIPVFKGMLGYRVFLINARDQARFDAVTNLAELAQLNAGQGSQWPDAEILSHNGLKVATTSNYELLYPMLRAHRFDYFPRGINEAWSELDAHQGEGLAVESRLMLAYPAPMYFFVAKDNAVLAERIERGLRMMLEDGSFDRYFYQHPVILQSLSNARFDQRRIFYLSNPNLPSATPLAEHRLWLRPFVEGGAADH